MGYSFWTAMLFVGAFCQTAPAAEDIGCSIPSVKKGGNTTLTCSFPVSAVSVGTIVTVNVRLFAPSDKDRDLAVLSLDKTEEGWGQPIVHPRFKFRNILCADEKCRVLIDLFNATYGDEGVYVCQLAGTGDHQECPFVLDRVGVDIHNTTVQLDVDLHGVDDERKENYLIQHIQLRNPSTGEALRNDTPPEATSNFALSNLKNNTKYEMVVYMGGSHISVTRSICIPTVTNLHLEVMESGSVRAEWDPSPVCKDSFASETYQVCHKKADSDVPCDQQCFANNEKTFVEIRNLTHGANYTICVRVVLSPSGHGPFTTTDAKIAPYALKKGTDGLEGWAIAVIVFVVWIIAAAVFLVWYCKYWSKKQQEKEICLVDKDPEEAVDINGGDNGNGSAEQTTFSEAAAQETDQLLGVCHQENMRLPLDKSQRHNSLDREVTPDTPDSGCLLDTENEQNLQAANEKVQDQPSKTQAVRIASLTKQLEEKEHMLKKFEKEQQTQKQKSDEKDAEIRSLRKEVKDLQKQLQEAEDRRKEICTSQEKCISNLEKQLHEKEDKLEKIEKELQEEKKNQVADLKEQLAREKARNRREERSVDEVEGDDDQAEGVQDMGYRPKKKVGGDVQPSVSGKESIVSVLTEDNKLLGTESTPAAAQSGTTKESSPPLRRQTSRSPASGSPDVNIILPRMPSTSVADSARPHGSVESEEASGFQTSTEKHTPPEVNPVSTAAFTHQQSSTAAQPVHGT